MAAAAWLEAAWHGQTPGKRLMGLMVLNDDGTPVRWPAALTRNLLRAADFLPISTAWASSSMLDRTATSSAWATCRRHRGGLPGASAAPTRTRSPRRRAVGAADPARSLAEQRALLELAERSATLTQERVEELAELPTPLVGQPPRRARGGES